MPQDSVLGPKIFIIVKNVIGKVPELKLFIFADDTNILCFGHSLKHPVDMVQTELNK